MATLSHARRAKRQALAEFAERPEVNGIGITRQGDEYMLKINFERRPRRALPKAIDEVPVVYEVVGPIEKTGLRG